MFFVKNGGIGPDVFCCCHRQRDGLFRWNGRVQLSWCFQTSVIFGGFGQFWKLKKLPAPSKPTVGNPFHERRSRRNPFAQKLNSNETHMFLLPLPRHRHRYHMFFGLINYKSTAKTTTLLFWKMDLWTGMFGSCFGRYDGESHMQDVDSTDFICWNWFLL